jgi:hypothetical protein
MMMMIQIKVKEILISDGGVTVVLLSGRSFYMGVSDTRYFILKLAEVQKDFEIPPNEEVIPTYREFSAGVKTGTSILLVALVAYMFYRVNASLSVRLPFFLTI